MVENASKIEIEKLANNTLKKLKETNGNISFPIDPFQLLQLHNVIVTFSDFDKLEGLLLYSDIEKSIVSININRPIQRQRFTAAHELGHILLHAKVSGNNFLCPVSSKSNLIEREADEFANCLLMPHDEMLKQIKKYKNSNNEVDMDSALYISEYFGVSYSACVKTLRFKYNKLSEKVDNKELDKLINKYRPSIKRNELLTTTNDLELIQKSIDYRYFSIINTSKITGLRFIQTLVFHESRLERLNISEEQVNEIFADFRMKGSVSIYCKEENQNIIESLGNIELIKYCLETDDEINVFKMKDLHKLLYKYSPYPQYAGSFKNSDNMILSGSGQPSSLSDLFENLELIEGHIRLLVDNAENYKVSDYIKEACKIHHEITILHPFPDGNGRVSRGMLNWILRKKNLPPIYIDNMNKSDYLDALSDMDKSKDSRKLELIVIKAIMKTMVEIYEEWL